MDKAAGSNCESIESQGRLVHAQMISNVTRTEATVKALKACFFGLSSSATVALKQL
ncbi:hypothetical protein [Thermofilum pendens]|uniref:hypothetical protein n=1 Tax=Thermofilum pendens TaxID=2269 RepID=UPI0003236BE7